MDVDYDDTQLVKRLTLLVLARFFLSHNRTASNEFSETRSQCRSPRSDCIKCSVRLTSMLNMLTRGSTAISIKRLNSMARERLHAITMLLPRCCHSISPHMANLIPLSLQPCSGLRSIPVSYPRNGSW